jgi:hypothetical protein
MCERLKGVGDGRDVMGDLWHLTALENKPFWRVYLAGWTNVPGLDPSAMQAIGGGQETGWAHLVWFPCLLARQQQQQQQQQQ